MVIARKRIPPNVHSIPFSGTLWYYPRQLYCLKDAMQQPTTTASALPRYADWLTTDGLAEQVGASVIVVTNWIVNGIRTGKDRIRLDAVKVGGRWRIDPTKVAAFIGATTAAALPAGVVAAAGTQPTPREATAADLKRRAEEARARMIAAGRLSATPGRTRRRSMTSAPTPNE
jgi:hypothetical protein